MPAKHFHTHECPHEGGHVWHDPNRECPFQGKDSGMTCWSYSPDEQKHVPGIEFLRSHPFVVSVSYTGSLNNKSDYSKFPPRSE